MSVETEARPPEFPPGVDGRPYLRGLRHSAVALPAGHPGGAAYRRAITRDSPLRFALVYFPHYLVDDTTGRMSFSEAHLDLDGAIGQWATPAAQHVAWVLPRGGAKSTWLFLIGPAWALAHGHRRFFLAFSLTAGQAEAHLENLRAELDGPMRNELLLADFPGMAPKRGQNRKGHVALTGGGTLATKGMRGTALGVRQRQTRPDLIIGDDLEPDADKHTPEEKAHLESRLVNSILPMGGPRTVVHLAGTTTMVGSLMHDVVRAALPESDREHRVAPWIAAHRFVPRYWPPILDEGTDRERSLWPQRWSLETLRDKRENAPQDYALNYLNRPETGGARGWWRPDLIRYNPRRDIVRRVLSVDPAMSNNRRNDKTAVVLLGVDASGRHIVVEYAAAGQWHGQELLDLLHRLTAAHPRTLREWVVETQHGGDRWETDILVPRPPGVRFVRASGVSGVSKRARIEELLGHYQRRAVEHKEPLQALEDQQLAWTPAADKDDLLDAAANGVRHLIRTA